LVISFFATVDNYEYGFYWNLFLDGTFALDIKHTGLLNTNSTVNNEKTKYGVRVSDRIEAQIHQHLVYPLFNVVFN
jgi:primary-amine oxidase